MWAGVGHDPILSAALQWNTTEIFERYQFAALTFMGKVASRPSSERLSGNPTSVRENADRTFIKSAGNIAERNQDFFRRGIHLGGERHSEVASVPPRVVGTGYRPTDAVVKRVGFRSQVAMDFC